MSERRFVETCKYCNKQFDSIDNWWALMDDPLIKGNVSATLVASLSKLFCFQCARYKVHTYRVFPPSPSNQ
jgi:hypothetical protein